MSIYCTIFDIGEHSNKCRRMKRIGRGLREQDDSEPCTCGKAPIIYQESHVLPSNADKRGGCVMLAAIPSHITRNGRDDRPDDGKWYPWLRLSIFADSDSIVLTKSQAQELRDSLTMWIKRSAAERKAKEATK